MTAYRPPRIHQLIAEAIRALQAAERAYTHHYTDAPWPTRRSEPAALATGSHSDPTGQAAALHRDWLEACARSIDDVRRAALQVAEDLGIIDRPDQERSGHCRCGRLATLTLDTEPRCRRCYQRDYRQQAGSPDRNVG